MKNAWTAEHVLMNAPVMQSACNKQISRRKPRNMEIDLKDEDFKKEVLDSDLPVLVYFWAPWCGPCSMLRPVIEELADDYQGRMKVCKLNIGEGRASATEYGVMSIPTLIFFKDGKVVDTIVGVLPKARLEEKIKVVLE